MKLLSICVGIALGSAFLMAQGMAVQCKSKTGEIRWHEKACPAGTEEVPILIQEGTVVGKDGIFVGR